MNNIGTIFFCLLCIFVFFIIYVYTLFEYEAAKKFYPDLTLQEYVLLGDKLRITPREND